MKRRSTNGINPTCMVPGDLVLREDHEGRNLLLFLGWDAREHGRARILDAYGNRMFWFNEKSRVELWWIVGGKEVPV